MIHPFEMLSLPLSSLVLFATPLVAASLLPRQTTPTRQYVVTNRCPTAVNLYIGGTLDSNIPQNGSVTKTLGTSAGFFYTDANLGSPTAEGAAKAGFLGDVCSVSRQRKRTNRLTRTLS
jgi:hypothetical protein